MKSERDSRAGLIVLTIAGGLAFNYPLLSLFDHGVFVWGIPLQFLHLFVVWALLIAGIAMLIERHGNMDATKSSDVGNGKPIAERRLRTDD